MRDLGRLGDPGCDVCGKKNANRCVQCMMASYCSKECRADWPTHKVACKSTKGGTWHKITLSPPSATPYLSLLNRLDSRHNSGATNASTPPLDVHKGKVFRAKFQLSLSAIQGRSGDTLVYDRQRSFSLFWKPASQPVLFHRAKQMIGHKLKFYRWMKRTGDYDFEICLDRASEQDPLW